MDLTCDLIAIQSILTNVIKNTGEFIRVNYRGGNEDKILTVMIEIQKFLKSKNYISKDNKPNQDYKKQLEDIVLFLALNTTFKEPLNLEDYTHISNITPPLSKCLLVNIVYGLDLCQYCCKVIDIFPISFSVQLLEEMLHCLKMSNTEVQLANTNFFLKAAADKLAKTKYSNLTEEDIEKLCEITNMFLFNLSGVNSEQLEKLNREKIYNHMGFCLLALFEQLLQCDPKNPSLKTFIGNIIKTCCSIVRNVTVDIFCAWAEITLDEEFLQVVIANKAYLFIEAYRKFPEALELTAMLGSLARKPKSLTDQIYAADVNTMIKKINQKDPDQISWFRALVRSDIFENKKALECVRTWSHLCNESDVSVILNSCVHKNSEQSAKLVVTCASNLPLENLKAVTTTHFYKSKFVNLATVDVSQTLTHILNKIKENSAVGDDLTKEILILLIQRPTSVLAHLYDVCLKSTFYSTVLRGSFDAVKEIIKINDIGVDVWLKVAQEKLLTVNNVDNHIHLLKMLLEIKYFSTNDIILKVLYQMLQKFYKEKSLEQMDLVLQVFLGISVTFPLTESTADLIKLFLAIMNENRCKFLCFDGKKQQTAKHIVEVFSDVLKPSYNTDMELNIDEEDDFTRYYKQTIIFGQEKSIFESICNDFNIDQYGNCVAALLRVLPPAVDREWLLITQEIINKCGNDKCMELLTDVLILLCQLVETQNMEENNAILLALKYCVQNYGLVTQQKILFNSTLETEINVNKEMCRILKSLPMQLKEEEGLSLVSILTYRSLKVLAKDRDFLCRVVLIKNPKVCQVLAQKISG